MSRTSLVLATVGAVVAAVLTVIAVAALTATTRTGADERRAGNPPVTLETSAPNTATTAPPATPFQPARGHDWPTAVPADLSVSAGLPEAGGDFARVSGTVTSTFCDAEAFPTGEALDAERDGAVGPEYGDRRDLRVFADDRAAHAFLRAAATTATDCPEEWHGATRWLHSVTPVDDVGEESVRLLQTYQTDGLVNAGATWWNVTRVGNAVLVTSTGGEYLPGETLGQGIRDHDRLLVPIVDSMCVFSAQGCPGSGADIPADFPLAAGWPPEDQVEPGGRYGLRGPSRTLAPLSWNLCDQPFTASRSTDRFRAGWSNVEDFRERELLTFDDADQAVDFTSSFVAYWRGCDRYASGSGYESVQDVRPTTVGGESWALVSWTEYDGAPAVGLSVVHVTRVGRAVLIDTASNEGGAGADRETDIARQIGSQVTATASVVDAMCRFTEAGCDEEPVVLRHDGIGPFTLGMTRTAATQAGATIDRDGTGCTTWTAHVGDHVVRGAFEGTRGLVAISGSGLRTAEGIGAGSSLSELRRTYAHLTGEPRFLLFATVGDTATYRFELVAGRVANVMLLDPRQGCGN